MIPNQDSPTASPAGDTAIPDAEALRRAWRETVEQELKGVPFEKKLVTRTFEGVDLQPVYHRGSVETVPHRDALPGQAPFLRGCHARGAKGETPWRIAQAIAAPGPVEFNQALMAALARGQDAVLLPADLLVDAAAFATALKDVHFAGAPLQLNAGAEAGPIAALLGAALHHRGETWAALRGAVTADPLAVLASTGTLPTPADLCLADLAGWTAFAATEAPEIKTVGIDAGWVVEAGGNAVQELAVALAMAVHYLRALAEHKVDVATAAPRCAFSLAVGSQFFPELAKFRAFRGLWARVLAAYGDARLAAGAAVHARTARFNKTTLDPHVNLLRTTTEALAAVLGGADSVQVGAFDEVVRAPDDFSQRLARNIAIMLSEEFNFAEVADAAGGSWLVEKLTDELARKAWALFQDIEGQGGFLAALTSGAIQKMVAATADEKRKQLDTRRLAVLGTNLFPNLREKPLAAGAAACPPPAGRRAASVKMPRLAPSPRVKWSTRFAKAVGAAEMGATRGALTSAWLPAGDTLVAVAPVKAWRAAEGFEALRALAARFAQATGKRPQVFLAKIGPVKQHKPRADFSAGFFAVGGFEAIGKESFADAASAAQAAAASSAPVVVLCSTDETYPALVPAFASAVKAAKPGIIVILAGLPAEAATVAAYKQAGIDDFIHVRANVRELLAQLLTQIGAK